MVLVYTLVATINLRVPPSKHATVPFTSDHTMVELLTRLDILRIVPTRGLLQSAQLVPLTN